ncbi:hotdog fold thioesterase [Fodinisporobacter ferrooxydans]|uniref:Hotdog fold thioesterase n=1 Tax=Fodinisporobacter ferrooxydans TaxID=2901836 RepID=A0ABY4CMY7_9BACL|nr:hotdog fold thioesterase [Alicyclobacillaceae bacterium MYW30-H2]
MAEWNTKGTMLELLGIELKEVSPDRVVGTMPVDHRTHQPFGLLHGGASVALAETVASIGTFANIDLEKQYAVGLEINANHLRSKQDGIVKATAAPLFKGRTTMVWEIRLEDEADKLICISRCTVAIRDR